ncbi:MAG: NADP-dependent phosphogluconate dehydrogenase [Phycisphaerales bacterium]|nr:NADP-dependent phosphogluconate dehydrogenase [Phycisphaerales bacterium]MCB9837687.1 NADP-dependent phosphogluconate dehydrogenase [Phycisphaera sp.]
MNTQLDLGVIGLGVMGRSLALNFADHGFSVGGADLNQAFVKLFADEVGDSSRGFTSTHDLATNLTRPRRLMIMVPAGKAVDAVLEELLGVLEPGDIVIDGGNSHYKDTERRIALASERGILFVGAGVSGGEEGARRGPSIMPGGSEEAWDEISAALHAIAADGPDGEPCCDWLGGGGCGHAVKTVHNGIEYAFMQAICETYALLKGPMGLDADAIASTFGSWNSGDMKSFLLEITETIFKVRDSGSDARLVDMVLDEAQQKGTGKWTAEMALDLGVPCPTLAEAVFARGVSSRHTIREALSSGHPNPTASDTNSLTVQDLRDALFATVVLSFAQGLDLIASASDVHGWGVKLERVAKLWRAGCIIRISFLDRISEAMRGAGSRHLLLDPWFADRVAEALGGLRRAVSAGALQGVGCPVMASALAYYDTVRAARLPHNLLQAQRDAFGAHTYRRIDRDGVYHTDWLGDGQTRAL